MNINDYISVKELAITIRSKKHLLELFDALKDLDSNQLKEVIQIIKKRLK